MADQSRDTDKGRIEKAASTQRERGKTPPREKGDTGAPSIEDRVRK